MLVSIILTCNLNFRWLEVKMLELYDPIFLTSSLYERVKIIPVKFNAWTMNNFGTEFSYSCLTVWPHHWSAASLYSCLTVWPQHWRHIFTHALQSDHSIGLGRETASPCSCTFSNESCIVVWPQQWPVKGNSTSLLLQAVRPLCWSAEGDSIPLLLYRTTSAVVCSSWAWFTGARLGNAPPLSTCPGVDLQTYSRCSWSELHTRECLLHALTEERPYRLYKPPTRFTEASYTLLNGLTEVIQASLLKLKRAQCS